MQIQEFMQRYGAALFAKAEERFPARVKHPRLTQERGRTPMGAQSLAITALKESLEEEPASFLAGEMGTGKTFVGIRSLLEWRPQGRFLVLCPPHLVEKWAREVKLEGAEAVILSQSSQIERLLRRGPLFVILSREKAKLGPGWKPASAKRWVRGENGPVEVEVCPRCGRGVELLATRRSRCPRCKEPLWQVTPPRREALAQALKRKLPKGFFAVVVLDEAHEYKGGDSAQGNAAASLISWCGKALLLTGTLFGGYASTLYHLLARTLPAVREEYPRESDFIAQYGCTERVYRERIESGYGQYTRRRETKSATRERPGLSPLLLTHLLPRTVFLRLPEVAVGLPPYGEEVRLVEMEPAHREAYERFACDLEAAAKRALAQKSRRLLGALVQAGIQVPDTTWQDEAVVDPELGETVARFEALSPQYRHAKEQKLLQIAREETGRGRRVLVYVQGTEKRDQLERLEGLLQAEGHKVAVLRSDTVNPQQREAWVAQQVEQGVQVLVCHPRIVQTGLDLVDFPTIVFYQPEYSVYTLRQAARRSWRIGQRQAVRVIYLAYQGTLQAAALALIAQKARSSLAIEGELVEGGLSSLGEEDPTLALAKALAGATSLEWRGQRLGLEEEGFSITLPTLSEARVVRTRKGKIRFEAGQPVLFL